ncbi:hypothetical protein FRB90_000625, partial [Tulasnella sp. 427]
IPAWLMEQGLAEGKEAIKLAKEKYGNVTQPEPDTSEGEYEDSQVEEEEEEEREEDNTDNA